VKALLKGLPMRAAMTAAMRAAADELQDTITRAANCKCDKQGLLNNLNNNLSSNLNFWNNHLNCNPHTFLSQIIVSEFFFFIFRYQECLSERGLRLT
jgi:hypothetical protein